MVKIDNAKIDNSGNVLIKASYTNNSGQQQNIGIYKYFISNAPISINPDKIDHSDVSLVVYYKQLDNPVLNLDVTINSVDVMSDTLNETLFIYVVSNDDELLLCQCKDKYDMISVFPLCKIYSIFMGFIGNLNHDECNIPMNFIDLIMRYIYLMSARESGNHYRVKEIWDKYFKDINTVNVAQQNCGCHG